MTAHIWQIKTEQHKKRESFLKGLIFQHLVSLIPSFDMDEYSSLRRCLLELAKRHGGDLFDEEIGLIRTQLRVRLSRPKPRKVKEF